MKLSEFVIRTLATERLTRLVVDDELTRPVREAVGTRWPDSKMNYLVSCRACVSVWAGLAVSSGIVPRRVQLALALSSAMLAMDRQDDRVSALTAAKARHLRGI